MSSKIEVHSTSIKRNECPCASIVVNDKNLKTSVSNRSRARYRRARWRRLVSFERGRLGSRVLPSNGFRYVSQFAPDSSNYRAPEVLRAELRSDAVSRFATAP